VAFSGGIVSIALVALAIQTGWIGGVTDAPCAPASSRDAGQDVGSVMKPLPSGRLDARLSDPAPAKGEITRLTLMFERSAGMTASEEITIRVDPSDGFIAVGDASWTFTLAPGASETKEFPLRAIEPGLWNVVARGESFATAVPALVLDGQEPILLERLYVAGSWPPISDTRPKPGVPFGVSFGALAKGSTCEVQVRLTLPSGLRVHAVDGRAEPIAPEDLVFRLDAPADAFAHTPGVSLVSDMPGTYVLHLEFSAGSERLTTTQRFVVEPDG
jgi:hypothetical protein